MRVGASTNRCMVRQLNAVAAASAKMKIDSAKILLRLRLLHNIQLGYAIE